MKKLQTFLKKNSVSVSELARSLDITRGAVYHWLSGKKIPSEENMEKIFKITKGQVTPNDFYDIGHIRARPDVQ